MWNTSLWLNIPQYTTIINKYRQSPFPADSEWKRAGEKKKMSVYVFFIILECIQASHQAAEREKQRTPFSYASHTWKECEFSHQHCPQWSLDPESRIFLGLRLWTVKDYFAGGGMRGSFVGQEAIRPIVFCEGGTAGLGQQEGGLSWCLFTCRCISLNCCGACSTALPAPAWRLIMHEVPEARDSRFTFDVTNASLRWQSCLILGILTNPVAVRGYFSQLL